MGSRVLITAGWYKGHDVSNLFVSDGSVMTTGAAANPTLTTVSLAIWQAEYLAGQLNRARFKKYWPAQHALAPVGLP